MLTLSNFLKFLFDIKLIFENYQNLNIYKLQKHLVAYDTKNISNKKRKTLSEYAPNSSQNNSPRIIKSI